MVFRETALKGAYVVEVEKRRDVRGFNARMWCQREFGAQGLAANLAQINIISNKRKGTLRGMHYQAAPHGENKLFRCSRGAVFDVIIDLRAESSTYKKWIGVELTAKNYRMLYVPENFAQGFLTLEDDTELAYHVSEFYAPQSERGVRYDDPTIGIRWPAPIEVVSDKDKNWPDLAPKESRVTSRDNTRRQVKT
jgi:dTDP-4-dehydrorhamnose 3,5-epimerase